MKSTVSEPNSWKRVIDIEVPHDEVDKVCEDKLQKVRKELSLPGFRPGKVPLPLIRQRYGDAIRSDAIDDLIQNAFKDACTEKKIIPISKGVVNNLKAEPGQPLTFTIEAEVDPEIELRKYNKRKVKVSAKKIKEEEVDESVMGLRERFAVFTDVDRPSKKGDYVKLEYLKVVIDGTERMDVKNPAYPVELGAEHRIKDFDKGLIGHAAGETVDLGVTFPKDYADKDVAGKGGEFTIKISAVQEKSLPEVATFLKQLGDFENEEALRLQIRKNLEAEALEQAKNEAYNRAIDDIIEDNPFDVPPARIGLFIDFLMEQMQKDNRQAEPLPPREEVAVRYRDMAVRTLKRHRIVDYIAAKEKIQATQEEVDAEIRKLAVRYNQPFDTLKQSLRQNGTTLRIRDDLREQKTLDFLVELPDGAGK
ncbi:MAG: trigger factor [Chitinispirillaceae bacterium]|nr:trigger factor [Chitinispirillaceae bacterium]